MESGEQLPEVRGGEQVGARGVQQLEGRRLQYPLRRPFPHSCEQHLNCLYGIPGLESSTAFVAQSSLFSDSFIYQLALWPLQVRMGRRGR